MKTWQEGTDFKANLRNDRQVPRYLTEKDLEKIFDLDYYLRNVETILRKAGL